MSATTIPASNIINNETQDKTDTFLLFKKLEPNPLLLKLKLKSKTARLSM